VYIYYFLQTATNVTARHELLKKVIGVFPEEEKAYETICLLSWILPLIAIIGSLLDTILVVVFMKLAHPWKDILFGQIKKAEEAQSIEEADIQDTQSRIQVRFSLL
jgi:hydrogenase-4 membrane subunit HyfE